MTKYRVLLLSIVAAFGIAAHAQEPKPIVRLEPAFDAIVPPNAKVEKIAGNLVYGLEGPLWIRKGGYLIFSGMNSNLIYKWNPKDGKVSNFLEHAGFTGSDPTGIGGETKIGNEVLYSIGPNGSTLDPQGRIVFCAQGDRQVVRLEKDGRRTVLASHYQGKRLNSPNDLIYKKDGALYFTDPAAGLREREKDPKKELPFLGVFLLKDGKLQKLLDNLQPNGIALDPSEKYLYVNDNASQSIMRYEVQRDDTIANGKVFVHLGIRGPGGTKVDKKGNVYCTTFDGVWVISPEGKHLGTIPFPQELANISFGDPDGKTLYAAGRTELYRIRFNIPGIHP